MMNIKNSMKVSVIAATILPVALNGQVRMTVPPQAEGSRFRELRSIPLRTV